MKTTLSKYLKLAGWAFVVTASAYALTTISDTVAMQGGIIGASANNSITSTPALVIGFNNVSTNNNSAAIGTGITTDEANSVAVGKYNAYASNSTAFVVGNGTSDSARSNSLHVGADGKVTIGTTSTTGSTVTTQIYGTADIQRVPVKGGISMGAYQ